jgi:hypothetical protein
MSAIATPAGVDAIDLKADRVEVKAGDRDILASNQAAGAEIGQGVS